MNILVTGGAGFIGSHLIDSLIRQQHYVVCVDDLSLGRLENIQHHMGNPHFKFTRLDILDKPKLNYVFSRDKFEYVFHLAANSDIREGTKSTDRDLKLTFLTTYNVLECMKNHGVKKIVFTSTPAVYGCHEEPLAEQLPMRPESLYGASKLASEAFIRAFSSLYDMQIWILRLSNMIGERATHGIIVDFLEKIATNQEVLEVLGDGNQCKPYMYVHELIDCILFVVKNSNERVNEFNVGPKDYTKVSDIAKILLEETGQKRKIVYTSGPRGWKGDISFYCYNTSKLEKLGWSPKMGSTEAVRFAIKKMI